MISGYISTVSRNKKQLNLTMDLLLVELVGLLKHAGMDGKILTWDLHVISNAVSVKLVWIKLLSPLKKQEKLSAGPRIRSTSHLPPGEETHNAWTSGRRKGKPLVTTKLVFKQTDDINPSTDETTQTDQLNSDAQAINIPTVLAKKSERSTQTRCTYTAMQPILKKTLILRIPAKNGKAVQLYEVRTTE